MKRKLRILALCLAAFAFAALFAGCELIDDMRASHAVLSEDRKTITYQGQLYKQLPDNSNIFVTGTYHTDSADVILSEHDVPVLLSYVYGESFIYNADKDIFSVMTNDLGFNDFLSFELYGSGASDYDYIDYCNAKDYDKYVEAIDNGVLDYIGVSYSVVDEDYNYSYPLIPLSQELSNEILSHIQFPTKMSNDIYLSLFENNYVESLQNCLYKCDKEGLLAEDLYDWDIYRNPDSKEIYLVNNLTEVAVELSDSFYSQMKEEYFYGIYPEWAEIEEEDIVIGSADWIYY